MATATAAGALAWLAIAGGASAGPAGTVTETRTMKSIADEGPGYAVEDFGYPDADKILTEKHITLKRGDGHIVLADCASATDLLQVWSRDKDRVCFKVSGTRGYLALEIPTVYAVRGNTYAAQVDLTSGTEEKTFDVTQNTWTPVGESADEQGRDFMLMEIRTTK
ncbi:hypothetical protein PUR59_18410 [Streptomyces sp. SP18ES09]|uniref:hypothetical protein n=1 Tax=Streptomyces sp. SP18ES09 TaxID=3002532 RepID=UPI002E771707|nr:hypothetical protein [Streptomyces sp. SP18ES09]MEE1816980.1 hypothetical protein [Streptomyces sp. SP18ES09]